MDTKRFAPIQGTSINAKLIQGAAHRFNYSKNIVAVDYGFHKMIDFYAYPRAFFLELFI